MTRNEADIQSLLRMAASAKGMRLFRNNVGVMMDSRGVPVRYGLANESKLINQSIKSADLIGIRPVMITQDMVGTLIGQFVSIECKHPGWKFNPKNDHEIAQKRWADLINLMGGMAVFNSDGKL